MVIRVVRCLRPALMEQGHKYPHGGMVYAAVLEAVLRGLSSNLSEGTRAMVTYRRISWLMFRYFHDEKYSKIYTK